MTNGIKPHGGALINRFVEGKAREDLLAKLPSLLRLKLGPRELSDVEMISVGAMSPLEGFMGRDDYNNVLDVMRLANGLPWTIPVTLAVSAEFAAAVKEGDDVALVDDADDVIAVLHLAEKFQHDKQRAASAVYGTDDRKHPGVDATYSMGDMLLGGRISALQRVKHNDFLKYRLDPAETRAAFAKNGWKRIVGFQTRNPVHRAHEYLQKCALEVVDGILLHPLVGETKGDDLPAPVRIRSYEILLEGYYPKDRALLSVFPATMRYAGPREAIFHALLRKNYGCTHFIVGRDHAGVGSYYGSFDAHYIFDNFSPDEIGITPLFFDNSFYCKACGGMASFKTCPHDSSHHVSLSGTKVREMLRSGQMPPAEFTRPEVAQVLIEGLRGSFSYNI